MVGAKDKSANSLNEPDTDIRIGGVTQHQQSPASEQTPIEKVKISVKYDDISDIVMRS